VSLGFDSECASAAFDEVCFLERGVAFWSVVFGGKSFFGWLSGVLMSLDIPSATWRVGGSELFFCLKVFHLLCGYVINYYDEYEREDEEDAAVFESKE
jgi:hypothetical protein